jgi:hypothetical protein
VTSLLNTSTRTSWCVSSVINSLRDLIIQKMQGLLSDRHLVIAGELSSVR